MYGVIIIKEIPNAITDFNNFWEYIGNITIFENILLFFVFSLLILFKSLSNNKCLFSIYISEKNNSLKYILTRWIVT